MITAIDTNVLLDIVRPNEKSFAASVEKSGTASQFASD